MKCKKVCIVGLGYIGLPTAAVVASAGNEVVGLDTNKDIVDKVNRGQVHIVEPNLEQLVNKAVEKGNLRAIIEPEPADVFLVAVPTPFKDINHTPDLSYVEAAARTISSVLKKGDLVILESTSPVGTTAKLNNWLADIRPDLNFVSNKISQPDIFVAYCPERVLPGNVIEELKRNDRVIGGLCVDSSKKAVEFYQQFVTGICHITNSKTAEMSKLVENSYRDVNIAFANELSSISKDLDINVWELISLANKHPRVNILNPGAGVGGHCIAVDPWFIISQSPQKAKIIKQAREVNDAKPYSIVEDIVNFCDREKNLSGAKLQIGLFGLSYKPDIDDLRESPSVIIANELSNIYPDQLQIIEPHINEMHKVLGAGMRLSTKQEACSSCDLIVILVPHTEFQDIFDHIDSKVSILDYCGLTET